MLYYEKIKVNGVRMMNKKVCHIIGAGEFEKFSYLENDFIIAADGGYEHIKKIGIKPNLLIGDFDSIKNIPHDIKKICFPTKKDFTDTYAAIQEGIKYGCEIFHIHGGTGARFAHTIANMQLLADMSQKKFATYLHGRNFTATAITNDKILFDESQKGYISIFSHTDKSFGVNIIGLKYELKNAVLTNKFPLGVSNEFLQKQSLISVERGTLILIY